VIKAKGLNFTVCGVMLTVLIAGQTLAGTKPKFGLKLSGGIGRQVLGDVNRYLDGAAQFRTDDLKSAGYVADQLYQHFNLGQDAEITALLSLSRNLDLTLGAGYLRIHKGDNALHLDSSFSSLTAVLNHNVSAVPLTLGISISFPVSAKSALYLFANGGIYWAKFSESGTETLTLDSGEPGYDNTWDADTSAVGLGFQGGLGFEIGLLKSLSLVVEAQGRYARISGFTGTSRLRFNAFELEKEFRLYYYELYNSALAKSYISLNLPNGEYGDLLLDLRDAVIDLSGVSFRAGFKIGL
jgi:hypothetical protein